MEEILEHFGTGILSGAAGVMLFLVVASWIKGGGIIYELVLLFLQSICG